jgi:hypothetical protein
MLQRALRPCVTTGIALVGAGVIAVTPVTAPPPELHLPAVTLTANPVVDAYRQLLQNTWTDLQAVGSQAWNQGLPILEQLLINTRSNLDIVAKVPPEMFNALKYSVQQIRPTLDTAGTQLQAGQVGEAINTLWSGLVINPLVGVAFPLLNTLQIPVNMAKTFARVVEALPTAILLGVGLPVLSTMTAVVNSLGVVAQGLYDGITTGNLGAVLTTVLTAPATVIGGALNGDPDTGTVGLINGLIAGILNARQTIADAMAPPPAPLAKTAGPATLATAAATDLPASTAATVTLETAPTAPAATDTKAAEGTKAEATQPQTTEPATTEASGETGTKVAEASPVEIKTEPVEDKAPSTSTNGATDLSDGNKVTPGDKVGDTVGQKSSDTKASETASGKTADDTAAPGQKDTTTTSPSGSTDSASGDAGGSGSSGATAGAASSSAADQ